MRCFILPLAPQNRLVWRCFRGKNNAQCPLYEVILARSTRGCQAPVVSVFVVSETHAIGVEAEEKDGETHATVIETGVTKSMRLEYILSCQLQGSPPKLRIPVMSSIDSDHPLISGRHAIG